MKNFCKKCGSLLDESNACPNCKSSTGLLTSEVQEAIPTVKDTTYNYYLETMKKNIKNNYKKTILRIILLTLNFCIFLFSIPIVSLYTKNYTDHASFFECMDHHCGTEIGFFVLFFMFLYLIAIIFETLSNISGLRSLTQKLLFVWGIILIFLMWIDLRAQNSYSKYIHIGIGGWLFIIILIVMMFTERYISSKENQSN